MFCVQFRSLSLGRADTRYFVKTFQTLQKAIGCWLARIWFAFNFLIQLTFIPFLGLFSVFSVYLSFNIAQANGSWKTTFLRELPFLRIYASGGIVCSLSSPNVPCISYISPAQVICFSAVLFYELHDYSRVFHVSSIFCCPWNHRSVHMVHPPPGELSSGVAGTLDEPNLAELEARLRLAPGAESGGVINIYIIIYIYIYNNSNNNNNNNEITLYYDYVF